MWITGNISIPEEKKVTLTQGVYLNGRNWTKSTNLNNRNMKQKNNEGYVKQRHYTLYDWE